VYPAATGKGLQTRPANLEHAIELFPREGSLFTGALHFDQLSRSGHHQVEVDRSSRVLGIVQVEQHLVAQQPNRDRGHLVAQRGGGNFARFLQPVAGEGQGDIRAGNGAGARAGVGLQHVAVENDAPCPQRGKVGYRTQTAPDQSLDLVGSPRVALLVSLAANLSRTRQHRIFSSDPAFVLILHPVGDILFDGGRAQHPRVAGLHQHAALGIRGEIEGDGMGPQFIGGPPLSHKSHGDGFGTRAESPLKDFSAFGNF